jgi:hypothetical protein
MRLGVDFHDANVSRRPRREPACQSVENFIVPLCTARHIPATPGNSSHCTSHVATEHGTLAVMQRSVFDFLSFPGGAVLA